MANLFKELWQTKWIYVIGFLLVLSLLEFFKIRLDTTKIFEALGIILQVIVALITFFAVIALFRLEGLRSLDTGKKEDKDKFESSIIQNLSKYGTRIAVVLFLFLMIMLVSISNKANFLNFEFKLHTDTIILSFLIVSITYVLDGVISSLREENLKSKS